MHLTPSCVQPSICEKYKLDPKIVSLVINGKLSVQETTLKETDSLELMFAGIGGGLPSEDGTDEDSNSQIPKKRCKLACYLSKHNLCDSLACREILKYSISDVNNCFDIFEASSDEATSLVLCQKHNRCVENYHNSCAVCGYRKTGMRLFNAQGVDLEIVKEYAQSCQKALRVQSNLNTNLCNTCHHKFKDYKQGHGRLFSLVKDVNDHPHKCSNFNCKNYSCTEIKFKNVLLHLCDLFRNDEVCTILDLITMLNSQIVEKCTCITCGHEAISPYLLERKLVEVFGDQIIISSISKCPRYGKLVTWANTDIRKLLHKFIWTSKNAVCSSCSETTDKIDCDFKILDKAIKVLRGFIKEMCSKIETDDVNNGIYLDAIVFEDFVKHYAPVKLWNFFLKLTLTDREEKLIDSLNFTWDQLFLQKLNKSIAGSNFHPRVFLLSVVNYIYSSGRARHPMHLILADIVDKYTKSSSNCLSILNCFGICTSKDSLLRHVTSISTKVIEQSPKTCCNDLSFKIVSIDNINARRTYSRVRAGDEKRGIDDTSVQLAIPKPQSLKMSWEELTHFGQNASYDEDLEMYYILVPCEGDYSFFKSICKLFISDFRPVNGVMSADDALLESKMVDVLRTLVFEDVVKNADVISQCVNGSKSLEAYLEKINVHPSYENVNCYGNSVLNGVLRPNVYEYIAIARLTGHSFCLYRKNEHTDHLEVLLQIRGKELNNSVPITLLLDENETFASVVTCSSVPLNYEKKENLLHSIQLKNLHFNSSISSSYEEILKKMCSDSLSISVAMKPSRRSLDKTVVQNYELNQFSDTIKSVSESHSSTACATSLSLESIIGHPEEENIEFELLQKNLFAYSLCQFQLTQSEKLEFPGIKIFHSRQQMEMTEQSKIVYLSVHELQSDKRDSILKILSKLKTDFKINVLTQYLVVVGDAKVYDILVKIKAEFRDEMKWLCPFPGDWHTMVNYAKHLMKIYGPAGMNELVSVNHHGALYNSVVNVTCFEKTLQFLLQVWEAMYKSQLNKFFEFEENIPNVSKLKISISDLYKAVSGSTNDFRDVVNLLDFVHLESKDLKVKFELFCKKMCLIDESFRFWHDFVHRDGLIFIGFYLSVRSANWNLRNYCLKEMTSLFNVGDSKYYKKLLPFHLQDLVTFPKAILEHFEQGGFVVSIKGVSLSFVCFDECHEMMINCDTKDIIATYSHISVSAQLHYITYRAEAHKNVMDQLQPDRKIVAQKEDSKKYILDSQKNVASLEKKLSEDSCLFSQWWDEGVMTIDIVQLQNGQREIKALKHIFTHVEANALERADLLSVKTVGDTRLKDYIQCFILKIQHSMSNVNSGRKKFHNFGTKKQQLKKVPDLSVNLGVKYMKQNIIWAHLHNTDPGFVSQTVHMPLAIANSDGTPYKGDKSKTVDFFLKSVDYKECFILGKVPKEIELNTIILEGMFLINKIPLDANRTFYDYAQFLYKTWVVYWYSDISVHKVSEVHVVFDLQNDMKNTPKYFERKFRDKDFEGIEMSHITDSTRLPTNWANFLKNRKHKKMLVNYLCECFVELGKILMNENKTLYVSGGFYQKGLVKKVQYKQEAVVVTALENNHYEADLLVWLCAVNTDYSNILIYSPDTDVLHIGLKIAQMYQNKQFIIQLKSSPTENKYLHLTKFVEKLKTNNRLKSINNNDIPTVIQALFVATGCDYTSFFREHAKKSFLVTFFKYAEFICGKSTGLTSNIANYEPDGHSLLSFFRLIGCEYFTGLYDLFDTQIQNPVDLYNFHKDDGKSLLQNHLDWLEIIRRVTTHIKTAEEKYLPSSDALTFHWKRCCWVGNVWSQCDKLLINYPELNNCGWKQTENNLEIVWDSVNSMKKITTLNEMHGKGCGCKLKGDMSGCGNRCGCRTKDKRCRQGCLCKGMCTNTPENKSPKVMFEEMLKLEANDASNTIAPCDSDSESSDGSEFYDSDESD